MFIKWREENKPIPPECLKELRALSPFVSSKPRKWSPHRWYAYLAESKRIEGKPRQAVMYLGSIPARAMQGEDAEEWRLFWYKVNCSLCLAYVDFRTYQHAIRGIGTRVTRPSDEELLRIMHEGLELHPTWYKNYKAVRNAVIDRMNFHLQ